MIQFNLEAYDRHVGLTLRAPNQYQRLARPTAYHPSGVYQYTLTPLTVYQTNDDDAMYHRESWLQRGYNVGTLYIDVQPNVILVPVQKRAPILRSSSRSGVYQYTLTPLTVYQTNDDDAMYHKESWRQRGYHVGTFYIDRHPLERLVLGLPSILFERSLDVTHSTGYWYVRTAPRLPVGQLSASIWA